MQMRNKRTILDVPTSRKPADCPVEDWLTFLGHRWNALLLWHLAVSPKRHAELITLLSGISSKVLAERLSALARRGLIKKTPLATFPRTVSYALSEQGAEIVSILNQIEVWTRTTASSIRHMDSFPILQ
ncbi:MAG: helix-turn-helix transcriptional regulator [Betaproteobacteria bacterium]|nr:helix-turn-helix transcriptional regulator [Betaproteobacteria bacterium]